MAKRTIRRRARKNRTIRKVMRGCNRRRMKKGGATAPPGTAPQGRIEVPQDSRATGTSNSVNAELAQHVAAANTIANNPAQPIPPATQPTMGQGISNTPANANANAPAPATAKGMQGGARTRHHRRRLRYKKSMARKSRHA